jgi:hypothetical protein
VSVSDLVSGPVTLEYDDLPHRAGERLGPTAWTAVTQHQVAGFAVFGIGLGKHHQFGVAGIASEPQVIVVQVFEFVVGQCKSQRDVCRAQCIDTFVEEPDRAELCRGMHLEKATRVVVCKKQAFRHRVDQGSPCIAEFIRQQSTIGRERITYATFKPPDFRQSAGLCYIACFAGPGGNRTEPRYHANQL